MAARCGLLRHPAIRLTSDFVGFHALLTAFSTTNGKIDTVDTVVDRIEVDTQDIQSHRQFLVKLEEQLELQGKLVNKMVNLQEEILRKLE